MADAICARPSMIAAQARNRMRSRLEVIGKDSIGSRAECGDDRREARERLRRLRRCPCGMAQLAGCRCPIQRIDGLQAVRRRVDSIVLSVPVLQRIGVGIDLRAVFRCYAAWRSGWAGMTRWRVVVRHDGAEMEA